MDLFTRKPDAPLAEKLRPAHASEVVGQAHLLGAGAPLRRAFDAKKLHSFVLWGPPGVGKTTIGRLAAEAVGADFFTLSAVTAGVKDIRAAVDAAQFALDRKGTSSVLFVDEIHSFNKTQQDVLLPHVESGLVKLVGSTTENPSFSLNNALLSRVQVYVLNPLTLADFTALYQRALPVIQPLELAQDALELLAAFADGDGRRFLNLLEQVSSAAMHAGQLLVDGAFAATVTSQALRQFDKRGDNAYDQISAFQKTIRGSHPDAALYWLARMLDGGMDPLFIARRLVVIASEDVGNADPSALPLAISAAQAFERLGSPEGERALAQATVYLAAAPKSNAVYLAWNQAKDFVRANGTQPVPLHLRNAPTELLKQLGHKQGYRYAHDEPGAYAAGATYLPEGMAEPAWYRPVDRGVELRIKSRLEQLQAQDRAVEARRPGKKVAPVSESDLGMRRGREAPRS